MKKMKYAKILIGLLFITTIVGCESESYDNISRLTYYPKFDMKGEGTMYVNLASGSYVDPGVVVTENGEEIQSETTINGNYRGGSSVGDADWYTVSYSATNKDGFSASVLRDVWAYNQGDLVNSIEGLYKADIERNGRTFNDLEYVLIWKNSDGTYGISDAIGGYYAFGTGYGVGYAAQGIKITANDISANDFSFSGPIGVGAFGGQLEMTSLSVDSASKQVKFSSEWSFGYTFNVVLKQVEL